MPERNSKKLSVNKFFLIILLLINIYNIFYKKVNIFDRGVIANLRNFFSGDILWWWLPFETEPLNDGYQF